MITCDPEQVLDVLRLIETLEIQARNRNNRREVIRQRLAWARVYTEHFGEPANEERAYNARPSFMDNRERTSADWHRLMRSNPLRVVVKRDEVHTPIWNGRGSVLTYNEHLECGHVHHHTPFDKTEKLAERRRCKPCGQAEKVTPINTAQEVRA